MLTRILKFLLNKVYKNSIIEIEIVDEENTYKEKEK